MSLPTNRMPGDIIQAVDINQIAEAVNVLSDGGIPGSGGTTNHSALTNRDAADQHPIGAITGLQGALDGKSATGHTHAAADVTSGTIAAARLPTGTTGSTVALGNHTHTPAAIGAAPASHTHDASDLSGVVKTVNGTAPDGAGNVVVAGGGGGGMSGLYSTAIDGDVTVTGAVTLTRDMHYDTLTISATGSVFVNQYRLFARKIVIAAGGRLHADGVNVIHNAGSASGGSSNQRPLGRAFNGPNGNAGGGTAGGAFPNSVGGSGGSGGDGEATPGGAGGVATYNTAWDTAYGGIDALLASPVMRLTGKDYAQQNDAMYAILPGGGGSGGSAGAGNSNPTQNVSGGGGGGGVLLVAANDIDNAGTISANGGNGHAYPTPGTSGSGGGGGGLVLLTADRYTGNLPTASGGIGGFHPDNPARGGQDGQPGRVIVAIGEVY